MNRTGDEVLARAAFAGDQDREVVTLHTLNLIAQARHRGAGADESREERLERPFVGHLDRLAGAVAQAAQLEALSSDVRKHAEPPHRRIA
jgi:hypothetical protein